MVVNAEEQAGKDEQPKLKVEPVPEKKAVEAGVEPVLADEVKAEVKEVKGGIEKILHIAGKELLKEVDIRNELMSFFERNPEISKRIFKGLKEEEIEGKRTELIEKIRYESQRFIDDAPKRNVVDAEDALWVLRDKVQVVCKREELELDARNDHLLVNILNRRSFDKRHVQETAEARRNGNELSLIFLDHDKFKDINDEYGHLIGDEVLKRTTRILLDACRVSDVVARYGGDELVALLPSTSKEGAKVLKERIEKMILDKTLYPIVSESGEVVEYSVGIGVSRLKDVKERDKEKGLIRLADEEMLRGKKNPVA